MRDNGLELELTDAVCEGSLSRSKKHPGENVVTKDSETEHRRLAELFLKYNYTLVHMFIERGMASCSTGEPLKVYVHLHEVSVLDKESYEKIRQYVRRLQPAVPRSDVSDFAVLAMELLNLVMGHLSIADRVNFARSCVQQALVNRSAHTTGTLKFHLTCSMSMTFRLFLLCMAGYKMRPAAFETDTYKTWTLSNGVQKIKVIEHRAAPMSGILGGSMSMSIGYWDSNMLQHAYPHLMEQKTILATPRSLPIDDSLEDHITVWDIVHNVMKRELSWAYEFDEKHVCRQSTNCPATLRVAKNSGWLNSRLPSTDYGSVEEVLPGAWSLFGAGCTSDFLKGNANMAVSHR
ncbi:hypothetical protein DFH07DRAFT_773152 [Mycena maculata]|uniref:Uncharacterized protein n=1 Tax=Mycena maculata TaxID=230809 RepID=A0AAD7NEI7_9AGAR|nr:hypothetical protein DFH07DRAFT_773152 [Mycena maculata]